ncbi:2,3,4,5-tetrahydropyridine-2,6-carboxylate N-succinyltransferase [Marinitoga sp. 1197]|uniref:2,3,4,5-tetrahydropyridine-2,6-dicarboxylate N-acetyltransferase n=1 Tax=unclassified Marinitoga TaxID=2640159 RepID=UPI0006410982|nr:MULTISPECIES: 2,3,4,5-tetrahydropyridine-2,6-dicarboxylate N-acetyltransferase [unclassified Marinitoga]KLO24369.1 2,3,4,5-tetrahydropyridine-2,6-carboxylate N-succinyltransferase [Marinitoga sp. 1155]KLO24441.1 2,3,4,5-tetrahydropyridine-2,6-carboxylate N-succinyltransferase [Marinitoga sp. 1197]NUU99746.1 2,3,4,5-tetrahydropyridine-2,6-carboxylate N-succinyltransferase [Marinitoga sp. 1154]
MNSYEIIEYIARSKKSTPIKVYLRGNLKDIPFEEYYGNEKVGILFCELEEFEKFLNSNKNIIEKYRIEMDRRNSAIPLLDLKKINARIEPGAVIRDLVEIGDNAVIMMGAVINIGAKIGKKTMIDMNVVIGGRAQIGNNCHIGAGSIIAGVIEPPSADPVIIEDNVLIGANAVILEGVKVGKGSVVAAGSVVTKNVDPYTVVAGIPARVIKKVDEKTKDKTRLLDELRNL